MPTIDDPEGTMEHEILIEWVQIVGAYTQTQRRSEGSGKRRKWENPDTKHIERGSG